ncbi:hypothetical protein Q5P01_004856 [Channa striata]|uniref:ZP domain-containing protein n=1 Tax=Channa striata TaxID=64152 RepID=A0AA88T2I1_CHASR|nr:hypothetical protein Q5P01_004856 [Channa striata]
MPQHNFNLSHHELFTWTGVLYPPCLTRKHRGSEQAVYRYQLQMSGEHHACGYWASWREILEVAAVMNNSSILLTPSLASQCGFSVKTDQLGNAKIYASLQNCFVQNVDSEFTTTLSLRLHGNQMDEDELYQVAETCQYATWASREIVCDHDYMEVSVRRAAPDDYGLPKYPIPRAISQLAHPRRATEKPNPTESALRMTTLVFFTPEERTMKLTEALKSGYGLASAPSRIVLRSRKTTPETYIQNVAGVPMTVLKTSTIFEQKWLATKIDAAAACPLLEGSVSFTPDTVTWFLPWHIDPLVSSDQFKLLEVHVGISGQRLDAAEMAARQYSMSVNDVHVVIGIPVGAVGGYFKSHIQDDQYLVTYSIEPMVELLWTEDGALEDTRYKVLFPITTPLLSQPPHVIDNTVPREQMFKMLLGPFGTDVALVNISFPSEVLSVASCNVRGFNVLEHVSPNGNTKVFTIEVPFMDPVVVQTAEEGLAAYSLHLTFGLLVLPEFLPFSHTAHLEAKLTDTVPPSVSSSCDGQNFYVLVKYGTQAFEVKVGKQTLTPDLAQQYGFRDNGTHFSLTVPFLAPDVVFEALEKSSVRSRLDLVLWNLESKIKIKHFSVACNFFSRLTECFPNGTVTVLALKLESVPSLNTAQLTLRDPTCGPSFTTDHFAYFIFTVNSCGTSRKFLSNGMVYENEISQLEDSEKETTTEESAEEEPPYELKVSCFYAIDTTHSLAFHSRPRMNEPNTDDARGKLQAVMRLALDDSYSVFYRAEDYPIAKYLKQPLYFEVELMGSTNSASLELENCWLTLKNDRTSQPRWNLITDGCADPSDPYQVVFHPVQPDARVKDPFKFKRFEVLIFPFAADQENSRRQRFVHCDVVICDGRNPLGGICNRQCPKKETQIKGKRAVSHVLYFKHVTSGPIDQV